MPQSAADLSGKRFGRLTAIERITSVGPARWRCRCECGNSKDVYAGSLTAGHAKSCGCYRDEMRTVWQRIDLTGRRFGRWTVISAAPPKRWLCRCDCGTEGFVAASNLSTGGSKSCGCLRTEQLAKRTTTHGLRNTPEYKIWCAMKERCQSPKRKDYAAYGGRGIRVCDEWLKSFAAFYAYIGKRPSPAHSLDRYPNNDGNYEPGNVRWATRSQQMKNRRKMKHRRK